jgi:hypothetical protein
MWALLQIDSRCWLGLFGEIKSYLKIAARAIEPCRFSVGAVPRETLRDEDEVSASCRPGSFNNTSNEDKPAPLISSFRHNGFWRQLDVEA